MTKITSVLINLLLFIEGNSSFQAPQPTIENRWTNQIAKRKRNQLLCWGKFEVDTKYINQIWIFQF